MSRKLIRSALALTSGLAVSGAASAAELLNVSYDPTRELYEAYNSAFAERWSKEHGQEVVVRMSHGGSAKQARSVIDGLEADVVTLAVSVDVDAIAEVSGLINADWQSELPSSSSPYTTVQVFLVREGNPKAIQDWDDLVRDDVEVITPNPKTSGGARWNFLAAWGYALEQNGGSEEAARDYVTRLYQNVPVLDTGARGSTNTFVRNGIGDVLITYENEALLAKDELGTDFEIVVPSQSILVETPVAVVDQNAAAHGTTELAQAYLEGLYTDWGQRIVAERYYRPRDEAILKEFSELYPEAETFTVSDKYGGWAKAQEKFFSEGGVFDQVYAAGR
jgi:sulfate/thiosulfate transport system substrate-binding protein